MAAISNIVSACKSTDSKQENESKKDVYRRELRI